LIGQNVSKHKPDFEVFIGPNDFVICLFKILDRGPVANYSFTDLGGFLPRKFNPVHVKTRTCSSHNDAQLGRINVLYHEALGGKNFLSAVLYDLEPGVIYSDTKPREPKRGRGQQLGKGSLHEG
jgi:hypothetical protein